MPSTPAARCRIRTGAALDTIPLFVEGFVVLSLQFAIAFGWDHDFGSHGFHMLDDGVRVVALVGQHGLGLARAQQRDGLRAVIHLATRNQKIQRLSQFIGQQMDLGRQTSSGTPPAHKIGIRLA